VIRVICIGDSITHRNHAAWEYPTYVREALGADFEVTNCGHNGALLTNQAARAGDYYPATQEYQSCRQAVPSPDVVTIMLGTNDSGYWQAAQASYATEYAKLISELEQTNPQLKVVAATPPAAVANWNNLISGLAIRDQIAPLVRSLAGQQGYVLADVQAATAAWFTSPDLTTYDQGHFADAGVHPNEAGARKIAEVFVAAIQAATAPEPPEPSGGTAGAAGAGVAGAASGGSPAASGAAGTSFAGTSGAGGGGTGAGPGSAPADSAGELAGSSGSAQAAPVNQVSQPATADSACSFNPGGPTDPLAALGLLAVAAHYAWRVRTRTRSMPRSAVSRTRSSAGE
jgi:lysophospholipase L1-like esterase